MVGSDILRLTFLRLILEAEANNTMNYVNILVLPALQVIGKNFTKNFSNFSSIVSKFFKV